MPKGAYTQKQERKADHIAEGYRDKGVSKKEAEERAWRTVNKQDGGGKNEGSGRSRSRSAAAKKGWKTPPPRRWLAGKPLEDFDPPLQSTLFAICELGNSAF